MAGRVCLQDLAQKMGVSRMTVSRALRHLPGVGDGLAEQIREMAERAGYQVDARVSSVMGAFRHSRSSSYRETLGFVFTHSHHHSHEQFEGAQEAAEQMGYLIDAIKPWESGMSGRNVSRVLQARGIRGVLLSPNSHVSHPHYTLDWSKFAVVLLGSSLVNKGLARVTVNHFAITQTAVRRLLHLGYQKPALVIDRILDERTNREISSAFRAWSEGSGRASCPVFFVESHSRPEQLAKWIRKWKPDALLSDTGFRLLQWLKPAGFRAPNDFGFAAISVAGTPGVSGINQDLKAVGSQAVQVLDSLLKLRQFGLQRDPLTLLVSGSWEAGTSAVRIASGRRGGTGLTV